MHHCYCSILLRELSSVRTRAGSPLNNMKKKFYHKLGPVPTEEDLKNPKKLNPNKARNTVIIWYSFVAISIILYFVVTKLF